MTGGSALITAAADGIVEGLEAPEAVEAGPLLLCPSLLVMIDLVEKPSDREK